MYKVILYFPSVHPKIVVVWLKYLIKKQLKVYVINVIQKFVPSVNKNTMGMWAVKIMLIYLLRIGQKVKMLINVINVVYLLKKFLAAIIWHVLCVDINGAGYVKALIRIRFILLHLTLSGVLYYKLDLIKRIIGAIGK